MGDSQNTVTRPVTSHPSQVASELAFMWLYPHLSDAVVELDGPGRDEWLVGRDEGCAIRPAGADISRRHARLVRENDCLFLVDLDSRNGTFVNGDRVANAHVRAGDILRFGGCVALLTTTPGAPSELAPGCFGGPLLARTLEPVIKAAASDLPIILQGETGTGKEVLARSIHAWSGRSGRFVGVNCAALPEALVEGELFGYRRGAFTGAERASPGVFRSAHEGTLLLDEVCELPPIVQAKLLRVLEQREVQPLGQAEPVPVDTRIVVAAQESLRSLAQRGLFRPDLFARLNGVSVELPPLRKRIADVPALFSSVLSRESPRGAPALEAELVEQLCLHDWPFNVREVVLLAKRLLVLHGDSGVLTRQHLPRDMVPGAAPTDASAGDGTPSDGVSPDAIELSTLMGALRVTRGNLAQAAASLGITRQRAYRLLQSESVDLAELRRDQVEP